MKKILIGAVVIIVLLVVGFFAFNTYIYKQKQGTGAVVEPYRATLSGVQMCLPHKDTSGPQTLECAIGIKTDAGEYYALDFNLMSLTPPTIANGQHFTASGVITPIERLSTDQWQKYNVAGIFSVTNAIQIEGVTPKPAEPVVTKPTPPAPASGKCYVGGCSSQLCSDQEGVVSTCEYTAAYGCYKNAICARQSDGKCGWTHTTELQACLANAQ